MLGFNSTVQYSTVQYSTVQYSTAQYSTAQHSTAQHSTAQHSTAQHSTAQHSSNKSVFSITSPALRLTRNHPDRLTAATPPTEGNSLPDTAVIPLLWRGGPQGRGGQNSVRQSLKGWSRPAAFLAASLLVTPFLPLVTPAHAADYTINSVPIGSGDVYGNSSNNQSLYLHDLPAVGNSVTVENGAQVAGTLSGGYAYDFNVFGGYTGNNSDSSGIVRALGNSVVINGGEVSLNTTTRVYGGYAYATYNYGVTGSLANSNNVTINGGVVGSYVYGGYALGGGCDGCLKNGATASYNTVTINGGMVGDGDVVVGIVSGGCAFGDSSIATASYNSVIISGGTVNSSVLSGGYAKSSNLYASTMTASYNSVTISGGEFKSESIVGGDTRTVTSLTGIDTTIATNNTVTIEGNAPLDISRASIYGGMAHYADENRLNWYDKDPGDPTITTGNTFNLKRADVTVAGLYNFQYLNFYLPADLENGGTMLTVTGEAYIDGSIVDVGVDWGNSSLVAGDTVTLIHAGALTGTPTLQLNGLDLAGSRASDSPMLAVVGNDLRMTVGDDNKNMTWTGGASNLWDIISRNWSEDGAADGATQFLDGDAVTFAPTANTTIDILGTRKTVAQMSVESDANLTINGNIYGDNSSTSTTLRGMTGGLKKDGTGTLTLNGNNFFTGAITLNGGVTNIGAGSTLQGGGNLTVGGVINGSDTGELVLTNGGIVTVAGDITLGEYANSHGTITVDGSGSALKSAKLFVGANGAGELHLTNGGTASAASGMVLGSWGKDASGTVTVDGAGSALRSDGNLVIGDYLGTGKLHLTNGGMATAAGDIILGNDTDSSGTVTVDGTGSVLRSGGSLVVGNKGKGELTLTNGGMVSANSIFLTNGSRLNVSASGQAAGIVQASTIDGNGTIFFNHAGTASAPYYFTSDGTSSGDAILLNGDLMVGQADGYTVLTGANSYTGPTVVDSGTLALAGAGRISSELILYSGSTFKTGDIPVNYLRSLAVYGAATYDGNLYMAGQSMAFVLPTNLKAGDVMLTVTGTADINRSQVDLIFYGGSMPLRKGDTVTLIEATKLDGTPADNTDDIKVVGESGVSVTYDFDISKMNNKQLLATVAGTGATVNQQTKALPEGVASGAAVINQTADFVADKGTAQAVEAAGGGKPGSGKQAAGSGGSGVGGFGAATGGLSRYNTGSHVDVSSVSLMAGLAWGNHVAPGRLTLGAFFEYGNGWYDTYNSFANAADVHGKGDMYHLGGGILGRLDFNDNGPGNFYTETSLRLGGVHNDYKNGDLRDAWGQAASYESSSAYYGVHAGLGYIWSLTEKAALDLYGKYFWTRQEGDSVRLSTGDPIDFDSVDSHRLRLGGRFGYAVNDLINPYVGAAYEQEFDGKAGTTTSGQAIPAPSLQGSTGIGEIGLAIKASKTMPLSVDLGVQGYVGTREGFTGSLQVRYEF